MSLNFDEDEEEGWNNNNYNTMDDDTDELNHFETMQVGDDDRNNDDRNNDAGGFTFSSRERNIGTDGTLDGFGDDVVEISSDTTGLHQFRLPSGQNVLMNENITNKPSSSHSSSSKRKKTSISKTLKSVSRMLSARDDDYDISDSDREDDDDEERTSQSDMSTRNGTDVDSVLSSSLSSIRTKGTTSQSKQSGGRNHSSSRSNKKKKRRADGSDANNNNGNNHLENVQSSRMIQDDVSKMRKTYDDEAPIMHSDKIRSILEDSCKMTEEEAYAAVDSFDEKFKEIEKSVFSMNIGAGNSDQQKDVRDVHAPPNGRRIVHESDIAKSGMSRYDKEHPSTSNQNNDFSSSNGNGRKRQSNNPKLNQVDNIDLDYQRVTPFSISRFVFAATVLAKSCATYIGALKARQAFVDAVQIGMIAQPDINGGNGVSNEDLNASSNYDNGDICFDTIRSQLAIVSEDLSKIHLDIIYRTGLPENLKSTIRRRNYYIQNIINDVSNLIGSLLNLLNRSSTPSTTSFDYCDALRRKAIKEQRSYSWICDVSDILRMKNVRKGPRKGILYRQVIAKDNQATLFWEPMGTYKIVVDVLLEYNGKIRDDIHSFWSSDNFKALSLVEDASEVLIPVVTPNNYFRAFANGWLDVRLNIFYNKKSPSLISKMRSSSQYHYAYDYNEGNYIEEGYSLEDGKYTFNENNTIQLCPLTQMPIWDESACPDDHWFKTSGNVPIIDSTVDSQNWSFHTHYNLCWSIARSTRPITDNHSVHVMFLGPSGSGKSSITDQISELTPSQYIKNIMVNIEKVFGLQDCVDPDREILVKHLYLIQDFNGRINLEDTVINHMVSGEKVEIAIKNKSVVRVSWERMTIWAANSFFSSSNDPNTRGSGGVATKVRRFFVFEINNPPSGTLEITAALRVASIPNLIRRATLCWHEFIHLRKISKPFNTSIIKNIWSFASPQLNDTRMRLTSEISFVHDYMASSWFTLDKNSFIGLNTLRKLSKYYKVARDDSMSSSSNLPADSTLKAALRSLYFNFIDVKKYDAARLALSSNQGRYIYDLKETTDGRGSVIIGNQLGEEMCTDHDVVFGLRISDSHLEVVKKYWAAISSASTSRLQENNAASDSSSTLLQSNGNNGKLPANKNNGNTASNSFLAFSSSAIIPRFQTLSLQDSNDIISSHPQPQRQTKSNLAPVPSMNFDLEEEEENETDENYDAFMSGAL